MPGHSMVCLDETTSRWRCSRCALALDGLTVRDARHLDDEGDCKGSPTERARADIKLMARNGDVFPHYSSSTGRTAPTDES